MVLGEVLTWIVRVTVLSNVAVKVGVGRVILLLCAPLSLIHQR